MRGWSLVFG
jgi:hypothetical protein